MERHDNDRENVFHESKPHENKKETVTFKKETLWKGATIVLGMLLVIGFFNGGFSFGKSSVGATVGAPSGVAPSGPSPSRAAVADMKALADDDPFLGDENAPVTIIEWSDYECPFCKRFYDQTLPQIKSQYVDTGKVKFVYRDFPLGFHQNAHIEAEAAECARDQVGNTAYFKYHDEIFKRTTSNGLGIAVDQLPVIAKDVGLDVDEFNTCLNSGKFKSEVDKDLQEGSAVGIQGTPGFIINGKLVSGAQPFSVFQQVIEAELN